MIITCQHEWVKQCLLQYRCNPPSGYHWEDAHYPLPRRSGEETVRLWYPHHIIQGCLQTLELGEPCIHGSKRYRERKIVEKELPEYLPTFDKAIEVLQKHAGKQSFLQRVGVHSPQHRDKGWKKMVELKIGVMSDEYKNSPEYLEVRVKSGKQAVEKQTGVHSEEYRSRPEYVEERRTAFALANSQKWISLIDGFISNAGGVAKHNRTIGADPNARKKL